MSRDILVCMVRPTVWRREHMTMNHEPTSAWVADGAIQVDEGETLGAVWISTHGEFIGPIAQLASENVAPGEMDAQWQPRVLRLGLLWVDNPITIVDPLSSVADPLWVSTAQWELRTNTVVWNDGVTQAPRSRSQWVGSHNTAPTKVEGMRLVRPGEGPRFLTFNGSESASPSPFLTYSAHSVINAVVSALILLPGEA